MKMRLYPYLLHHDALMAFDLFPFSRWRKHNGDRRITTPMQAGGHIHKNLELLDRLWRCPSCHSVNDRDKNAAVNIKVVGTSNHYGLGDVSQALLVMASYQF